MTGPFFVSIMRASESFSAFFVLKFGEVRKNTYLCSRILCPNDVHMTMRKNFFYILAFAAGLVSCAHKPQVVSSMQAEFLPVDSTLDAIQDSSYLAALEPLKASLEEQLMIPLGYAPEALTSGRPESTLLNWACDALKAKADEAQEELGLTHSVDFAVVNAGGLRCEWAAGDITFRHVFELMPFDNELVILTLPGTEVMLLAENRRAQYGQGVSRELRVTPTDVTLNGLPINPEQDYFVATSDYLSGGADGLHALTHFTERVLTGKKIRDLYIDYVREVRIVEASIDGRMAL